MGCKSKIISNIRTLVWKQASYPYTNNRVPHAERIQYRITTMVHCARMWVREKAMISFNPVTQHLCIEGMLTNGKS
jgi:hypothetical protein